MNVEGDLDISGAYLRNGKPLTARDVGAIPARLLAVQGNLLTGDGQAPAALPPGQQGQALVTDYSQPAGLAYSWGLAPVGAVLPWLKSLEGTPDLPACWLEANGQTVGDKESPYQGRPLPNLNGVKGAPQRFLRGAPASGGTGGHEATAKSATDSSKTRGTGLAGTLPPYFEVVYVIRIK